MEEPNPVIACISIIAIGLTIVILATGFMAATDQNRNLKQQLEINQLQLSKTETAMTSALDDFGDCRDLFRKYLNSELK